MERRGARVELRFPTATRLSAPPPLRLSAVVVHLTVEFRARIQGQGHAVQLLLPLLTLRRAHLYSPLAYSNTNAHTYTHTHRSQRTNAAQSVS
ncbi:hypothetical protein V9T40_002430 [Parthenolecanium corni]|uniref:Uncharacterized protein n=1 Tax=Parthenolecanium corni TaxID=536013 RepID=A0AAN9TUI4_9HEMI